jgi:transposase-like protein
MEIKKRSRRKFTDEFKRDPAALALDTGRPLAQVAREPDVYESSGRWVRRLAAGHRRAGRRGTPWH